jgi:hypothetical protein
MDHFWDPLTPVLVLLDNSYAKQGVVLWTSKTVEKKATFVPALQ